MMRRFGIPLLLVGSLLVATLGLSRLRFDTDILSMLPRDLPEVKGLKAYQNAFSRSEELIVLIQGGTGEDAPTEDAAAALGECLKQQGLAKNIRWRPAWNEEPEGFAELVAYLWLNGPAEPVEAQLSRWSPGNSADGFRESLDRVATSMEGMDLLMRAHDPMGFLDHPALAQLMEAGSGAGGGFESTDGSIRLLIIDAPAPMAGYREAAAWLDQVRKAIDGWRKEEGQGLRASLTGEPAFSAEIGTAMENDLSGSIGITLGLIGILFWWMQRRFSLLLGLTGVLVLVFVVALGTAGWIYGHLSIMALSSAEILIGLAVDYGLVICQEAKVAGHDRAELRKACHKPVFFGALTTSVVFLALNLGGLPGMAQLGSIVAIGLSAAALLMLGIYLPFVARFGVDRAPATGDGGFLPRSRRSWGLTGSLVLASAAVLAFKGLPATDFSSEIMRPRNSPAMDAFESLRKAFPAFGGEALGIVVEAAGDEEMLGRLKEAEQRLLTARKSGLLASSSLPSSWWPDLQSQKSNRETLRTLADGRNRLLAEASAAGFSDEGLALGKSVLDQLNRMSRAESVVFPESTTAREILRAFLSRDDRGRGCVAGTLLPADGVEAAGKDFAAFRALTGNGIWLSGWDLFKPAIAGLVREDLPKMLAPMFLLLVGMMALIFRRGTDVGLALLAMAVSTVMLLAVMSAAGLKWNFVNLMATPLLLGTGIDYAIHVTLSLRRTGGDFRELWQGTGKALLFCGASNVIGFGSLAFSSSDALVSLGVTAVIGILLSMAVSIFLLPGWRDGAEIKRRDMPPSPPDSP